MTQLPSLFPTHLVLIISLSIRGKHLIRWGSCSESAGRMCGRLNHSPVLESVEEE